MELGKIGTYLFNEYLGGGFAFDANTDGEISGMKDDVVAEITDSDIETGINGKLEDLCHTVAESAFYAGMLAATIIDEEYTKIKMNGTVEALKIK